MFARTSRNGTSLPGTAGHQQRRQRVGADFRTRYDTLTYEIASIPADVALSCHAYLKALGLELGVFDFAVADDGAWWFLECGPGSQWAWLEAETGAPIADAIADTLTGASA